MSLLLEGKRAFITGGTRGIGAAICEIFAREGADVAFSYNSRDDLAAEISQKIEAHGGKAFSAKVSVIDRIGMKKLTRELVEKWGGIDILVNNAAVRREIDFASLDYREWRDIIGTILDGAYLCSHAALPHLMASGAGAIINIGGLAAHTGASRRAHVIAAKAGLEGLTRALAHDLAPHGITVNMIAPGLVDTVRDKLPSHHAAHKPLVGRLGKPGEIAALVHFLCGPDARYITGQTIHANGGVFMG